MLYNENFLCNLKSAKKLFETFDLHLLIHLEHCSSRILKLQKDLALFIMIFTTVFMSLVLTINIDEFFYSSEQIDVL